jgi:hypothetical protein
MKVCSKCRIIKSFDAFYTCKSSKDGRHHRCKACRKTDKRPTTAQAQAKHRKKLYGLTPDQFMAMVVKQANACAICTSPLVATKTGLHVDHCHVTGKVRGLLCGRCNSGIGHLKDSSELCLRAAQYLAN